MTGYQPGSLVFFVTHWFGAKQALMLWSGRGIGDIFSARRAGFTSAE
jgi:hypothetical protein